MSLFVPLSPAVGLDRSHCFRNAVLDRIPLFCVGGTHHDLEGW